MKKILIACMMLGIISQGCKKNEQAIEKPEAEKPVVIIPEKPAEEGKTPEPINPPTNNNGIIHGVVNKELSYNKFFTIDVNGDGQNDLYFTSALVYAGQSHKYLFASSISTSQGKIQLVKSNDFEINGKWAAPLPKETKIDAIATSNANWENYLTKAVLLDVLEENSGNKLLGPWVAKDDLYLALELKIDGKTHYGWLRATHKAGEEKVIIADYAFNTVPMESIKAGQK